MNIDALGLNGRIDCVIDKPVNTSSKTYGNFALLNGDNHV